MKALASMTRAGGAKAVKPIQYRLEISGPGSGRDVLVSFATATPFMAISAGDIVYPELSSESEAPAKGLGVTRVEHIIWKTEGEAHVGHKVMIFTEELRLPKWE